MIRFIRQRLSKPRDHRGPKGRIVRAVTENAVAIIAVRFDHFNSSRPLAPGTLTDLPSPSTWAFDVYRETARQGKVVSFETDAPKENALPPIGKIVICQSWWLPEANEAVLDTKTTWEHRVYPDNGDHDHCLFTYEAIAAYDTNCTGYWSEKYGWITEQAYRDFIVADIYKLRSVRRTNKS